MSILNKKVKQKYQNNSCDKSQTTKGIKTANTAPTMNVIKYIIKDLKKSQWLIQTWNILSLEILSHFRANDNISYT